MGSLWCGSGVAIFIHGLRRIETGAQVHPASIQAVVGASGIRTDAIDDGGGAGMGGHHQHVLVTQREEIGTFPHRAGQLRVARE